MDYPLSKREELEMYRIQNKRYEKTLNEIHLELKEMNGGLYIDEEDTFIHQLFQFIKDSIYDLIY